MKTHYKNLKAIFMKKIICVLLIIMCANGVISQTLVDTTKKWSTKINRLPSWTVITEFIKFGQDTTIDSKTYKKVWRSTDEFQEIWISYGFIRENPDKKIYFRTDTSFQEYLLYDFELNVNDTVYSTAITSYADYYTLATAPFVVISIDSMLIGNEYKKQFNLFSIYANMETDQWIEGVGSKSGVLHWNAGLIGGDHYELLCFSENDTLKYQNPFWNTCYYVYTNIQEIFDGINVSIKPIPVTNISNFTIEGNNNDHYFILEIYHITGKKIISARIKNNYVINRNEFYSGLYLYRLFNQSGIIKTGKIIIK